MDVSFVRVFKLALKNVLSLRQGDPGIERDESSLFASVEANLTSL